MLACASLINLGTAPFVSLSRTKPGSLKIWRSYHPLVASPSLTGELSWSWAESNCRLTSFLMRSSTIRCGGRGTRTPKALARPSDFQDRPTTNYHMPPKLPGSLFNRCRKPPPVTIYLIGHGFWLYQCHWVLGEPRSHNLWNHNPALCQLSY